MGRGNLLQDSRIGCAGIKRAPGGGSRHDCLLAGGRCLLYLLQSHPRQPLGPAPRLQPGECPWANHRHLGRAAGGETRGRGHHRESKLTCSKHIFAEQIRLHSDQ